MTDEQINEKIAFELGWRQLQDGRWKLNDRVECEGPNYCNDLNACHEFAAWLDTEQQIRFAEELQFIVSENPYRVWWNLNANEAYQIAEATARQRAEAFLRTLNLWEE